MQDWKMRAATPADAPTVTHILNEAGARLEDSGFDQWGRGWMPESRMRPMIGRGETYVAVADGRAVATVTLSEDPGPFWTAEEREDQAVYMGKLARLNDAPRGIGAWIMNSWVPWWARENGYDVVRLDAWRTNTGLHQFYADRGWSFVRTEAVSGNKSGALFQRPAQGTSTPPCAAALQE